MLNQTNSGAPQAHAQGLDGAPSGQAVPPAITAGATSYEESDIEVLEAEAIDPLEAPAGRRAASFAAQAYKNTMHGEARHRPGGLVDAWDDDALSDELNSMHAADAQPAAADAAATAAATTAEAAAAAVAAPAADPAAAIAAAAVDQASSSQYSAFQTQSAPDITSAANAAAAASAAAPAQDNERTQAAQDMEAVPAAAPADQADTAADHNIMAARSQEEPAPDALSEGQTHEKKSDGAQPHNFQDYTSGVNDNSRHRETNFMTDEQNRAQEARPQPDPDEHSAGHAGASEGAAAGGAAAAAAQGAPWPGQMPPWAWPYPWGPRGAVPGMPPGMPPQGMPAGMPSGMPPGMPPGMMMPPPGFYPLQGQPGAQMRFASWPYQPFPGAPGAAQQPLAGAAPGAAAQGAAAGPLPGHKPEQGQTGAGAAAAQPQLHQHQPGTERPDRPAAATAPADQGAKPHEPTSGNGASHSSAPGAVAAAGAAGNGAAGVPPGAAAMPGTAPRSHGLNSVVSVGAAAGGYNAGHIGGQVGGHGVNGGGSGGRSWGGWRSPDGDNSWYNRGFQGLNSSNDKEKWADSLAVHIFMVAIISLLLLIPTLFFERVLDDRQYTENRAIESITTPWGDEQLVSDPLLYLSVPVEKVTVSTFEEDGELYTRQQRSSSDEKWLFISDTAHSTSTLSSETRRRGNYEAMLYKVKVDQQGSFDLTHVVEQMTRKDKNFRVARADIKLIFGIRDSAGIDELHYVNVNGRDFPAEPSTSAKGFAVTLSADDVQKIMHALPLGDNSHALDDRPALYNTMDADAERAREDDTAVAHAGRNDGGSYRLLRPGQIEYRASYTLRGSQKYMYMPVSVESTAIINGSGMVPSFHGRFLPSEHKVNDEQRSFEALYRMSSLATGTSDHMSVDDFNMNERNAFEVSLADRSISYTLIERLTKYVLLFIAMTFVTVLAFEIVSRRSVSLVQYVVVGAALILFYMVLLSMSEHFSFTISYVTAALIMSGMISLYLKAVLNSKRSAVCILLMLLAMYSVLFAIVHIQAYALLVGTILLVVMLGVVMFITRRLNQKGFQLLDDDGKIFGSARKATAPAPAAAAGASHADASHADASHGGPADQAGHGAAGAHEHSRIRTAPVNVPAAAPVHPSHDDGLSHTHDKDDAGK